MMHYTIKLLLSDLIFLVRNIFVIFKNYQHYLLLIDICSLSLLVLVCFLDVPILLNPHKKKINTIPSDFLILVPCVTLYDLKILGESLQQIS